MKKFNPTKGQLKEWYQVQKQPMIQIAKKSKVTRITVRNRLIEYKIPIRNKSGSSYEKFVHNEDFFKTWSIEMSWLLGYIAADGYVRPARYELKFKSIDYEMLKECQRLLESNSHIKPEKGCNSSTLTIYGKEIVKDLNILGIHQKKSLTLEMPHVPNKFFWDFLRGYVDGDGHISPPKSPGECQLRMQLVGSEPFLTSVQDLLKLKLLYHKGRGFSVQRQQPVTLPIRISNWSYTVSLSV